MFVSITSLNEGGICDSRDEAKKREFFEGDNPKLTGSKISTSGWQSTREESHLNSNWQKLRK